MEIEYEIVMVTFTIVVYTMPTLSTYVHMHNRNIFFMKNFLKLYLTKTTTNNNCLSSLMKKYCTFDFQKDTVSHVLQEFDA